MKMTLFRLSKESVIGNVKITVDGDTVSFNLHRETRINRNNLDQELEEHPAKYSYALTILAAIDSKLEEMDTKRKNIEAKLSEEFATSKESSYYKKAQKFPAAKLIDNLVRNHKKYRSIQEEYADLRTNRAKINALCRGLEEKSRMLQTLSANLRKNQ